MVGNMWTKFEKIYSADFFRGNDLKLYSLIRGVLYAEFYVLQCCKFCVYCSGTLLKSFLYYNLITSCTHYYTNVTSGATKTSTTAFCINYTFCDELAKLFYQSELFLY